jgi:hypothetical protein
MNLRKIIYLVLIHLACEQMVVGVRQLQKKKWTRQPINEMHTRARKLTDILCKGVRQLPMEDLCLGVGQLQLGVRKLLLKDLCVGVRQLQLEDMSGSRQLLVDGCYLLGLDNS